MKFRQIFTALMLMVLAAATARSQEATFEFATTFDAAQQMSGGEKPILLDFYTDW